MEPNLALQILVPPQLGDVSVNSRLVEGCKVAPVAQVNSRVSLSQPLRKQIEMGQPWFHSCPSPLLGPSWSILPGPECCTLLVQTLLLILLGPHFPPTSALPLPLFSPSECAFCSPAPLLEEGCETSPRRLRSPWHPPLPGPARAFLPAPPDLRPHAPSACRPSSPSPWLPLTFPSRFKDPEDTQASWSLPLVFP